MLLDISTAADPYQEEQVGTSLQNPVEAKLVIGLVSKCILGQPAELPAPTRTMAAGVGAAAVRIPAAPVTPEEIVILTPYYEQKRLLRQKLQEAMSDASQAGKAGGAISEALSRVRVSTIDGFQGGECDLVVFSAVRSNLKGELGFLKDDRRANVMLTRARRGLVVVADGSTFEESPDSVWGRWLRWVQSQDAVVSPQALGFHA
eukprot:TRINITY_DN40385_c0_g1_i2.p1 TRINITY_DN40385_c0_g1~~TRINITY_DN40385_c0_g1_i2.p1  ORF type:complete len:204 (+),score=34.95 TRINITY_DN40385_c0_g1_i2:105-716(+)